MPVPEIKVQTKFFGHHMDAISICFGQKKEGLVYEFSEGRFGFLSSQVCNIKRMDTMGVQETLSELLLRAPIYLSRTFEIQF